MTIVFVSNFINHYQVTVADALYELCNGQYRFIETSEVPEERRKGGFDIIERPYLIRTWKGSEQEKIARRICLEADVLVYLSELCTLPYRIERLSQGKLTFEYAERWLKRGFINAFSKTCLVDHLYYFRFRNKPLYKLCAGAYVPNDEYLMHSFVGKCYKFGYFSEIRPMDVEKVLEEKDKSVVRILWCARMIGWKRPEMVVDLARRLSESKLNVEINMIGTGRLLKKIQKSIADYQLGNVLHLMGGMPNGKVLDLMKSHHIFLLTSTRREGWGVVVNEAMANACCVVSSDAVGSVPYLIEDGVNGRLFRSGDGNSLYKAVEALVLDKGQREQLTRQAYKTISEEWSPERAAGNFVQLCESLLSNRKCEIQEGPCSPAKPYFR